MDSRSVGGVGGPNLPPGGDGLAAQQVAQAPGGPTHVLLSDDRAEHVPGCNMAFWKQVLVDAGGFDPVFTAAGDDVDICWRVLDRGWEIAYHPAAMVWHHRRNGLRAYLRQQRGYGRSEALAETRHPDRFTSAGMARWRGTVEGSVAPLRQRIYSGVYGVAAFQSVYRGGGYAWDVAHQVGVPAAVLALLSAPLGLIWLGLAIPASIAALFLFTLACIDAGSARPPRNVGTVQGAAFRMRVASMHVLQPLARTWGRHWRRSLARRDISVRAPIPGPAMNAPGGVLMLPLVGGRAAVTESVIAELRRHGLRVLPANGWEQYDARLIGSSLVVADLLTSAHPVGWLQIRTRTRLAVVPALTWLAAAMLLAMHFPVSLAGSGALAVFEIGRGLWRTGPGARRFIARRAAAGRAAAQVHDHRPLAPGPEVAST
jgi:hypothetical protein